MILDTSFLIDLMEGDAAAVAEARDLEASGVPQRIPTRVIYELYVGVGYTDMPDAESRKIQAVVESRPVENETAAIARLAGRIDGERRRSGERLDPADIVIGATARHLDEPVLTGNPADFERLSEVDVRTYSN